MAKEKKDVQKKDTAETPATYVGPKPNKVIKKKTRELIARNMMTASSTQGWHETAENPRKPDAEIAVEVLDAVTKVARTLAHREDPAEAVTVLAALSVSWLQNLTYSGKRSWT